jgi:hypothetical protein
MIMRKLPCHQDVEQYYFLLYSLHKRENFVRVLPTVTWEGIMQRSFRCSEQGIFGTQKSSTNILAVSPTQASKIKASVDACLQTVLQLG